MSKKVNPKIKAGCGVVSIFSLGFLAGAITLFVIIIINVNKAENWKTKESREYVGNHFANKLDMTEEQRAKFQPIVDEILERRWEMRRDYIEEDISMIEGEYLPRVNEILTEEQQGKARELIDKWRLDDAAKLERQKPDTMPEAE